MHTLEVWPGYYVHFWLETVERGLKYLGLIVLAYTHLLAPILSSPPNLVDTLFDACLCNTSLGVRVAAAAVLRQLAIAVPSQRVPLMDRCMGVLSSAASADSISGHSLALGGLVAGSRLGELGIPCAKGKAVSGSL